MKISPNDYILWYMTDAISSIEICFNKVKSIRCARIDLIVESVNGYEFAFNREIILYIKEILPIYGLFL